MFDAKGKLDGPPIALGGTIIDRSEWRKRTTRIVAIQDPEKRKEEIYDLLANRRPSYVIQAALWAAGLEDLREGMKAEELDRLLKFVPPPAKEERCLVTMMHLNLKKFGIPISLADLKGEMDALREKRASKKSRVVHASSGAGVPKAALLAG